jgi:DNA repair exonuclease SbcCD ATPase subunit
LDERNRALEQEKGQFAQFNGRPASPEQADQIQSVIRDYNARVTALKKAQEAFNAKVASINKIQLALRCKYEMNPAPVKTIEAWWPK